MNCVLYARVSTDRQADQDLSIPAQVQAMREYAHQRGWRIVSEYIEPGASAKTADRPELQRLLAWLRGATERVDVLLVHKIDRLARNVFDHAMIKALLKQRATKLASVVENIDDSVSGELVENIMASIAQFYSGNLSEEVKKGMRQKVLQGGWPHRPPRGYLTSRTPNATIGTIAVHPTDGAFIRQAFELYASGNYSMRRLSNHLADIGFVAPNGKPIPHAHLHNFLSNPFYVGRVRWHDLEVDGMHTPLVSRELFSRVQAIIRDRYRRPGSRAGIGGFPLRGLAICGSCRGRMTTERHERWRYYRCSRQTFRRALCASRYCNADKAHQDIERICRGVRLSPAVRKRVQVAADRLIAARTVSRVSRAKALSEERTRLVNRETSLTEAFLSGTIAPENYHEAVRKVRHDVEHVNGESAHSEVDSETLRARVAETLHLAGSLWDIYASASDVRKGEILRAVLSAVVLDPSGIAGFSLRPPFKQLASEMPRNATDTRHAAQALVDGAAA